MYVYIQAFKGEILKHVGRKFLYLNLHSSKTFSVAFWVALMVDYTEIKRWIKEK